jgi:hypothetical protein
MNHKNVSFAIAAILATVAAISLGFAAPQQVFAHRHHNNDINVNQQVSQLNNCKGAPPPDSEEPGETGNLEREEVEEVASGPTICLNTGDNQVDISK